MGAEVREPCLTEKALEYNFTNEGGVFGTWRLSKNIMGLWLVQECKRTWAHQGDNLSYDEITRLASEARPFLAVIDPDDDRFLHPGDMPERIRKYCAGYKPGCAANKGRDHSCGTGKHCIEISLGAGTAGRTDRQTVFDPSISSAAGRRIAC